MKLILFSIIRKITFVVIFYLKCVLFTLNVVKRESRSVWWKLCILIVLSEDVLNITSDVHRIRSTLPSWSVNINIVFNYVIDIYICIYIMLLEK